MSNARNLISELDGGAASWAQDDSFNIGKGEILLCSYQGSLSVTATLPMIQTPDQSPSFLCDMEKLIGHYAPGAESEKFLAQSLADQVPVICMLLNEPS